jgi:hypothetical protein
MTRTLSVTRWANLLGLAAALLSCTIPVAWAQDADSDPPVRVGRISYASGPVSFSPAGNEEWVEARINRPVVTGDRLWTDDNARAEVSVDNGTWWLGERTSLDVSNMDDRLVQMQVHEGVLEVRVSTRRLQDWARLERKRAYLLALISALLVSLFVAVLTARWVGRPLAALGTAMAGAHGGASFHEMNQTK